MSAGTTTGTNSSPTPTTAVATSPSNRLAGIPVYWIAKSRRSFALYREFRDVPDTGGPISSAVSAMTSLEPFDPDYMTPWRPASRVTVSQNGDALTVNLSSDASANAQVGSQVADRAVQQLVYTATAAAQQVETPASTVKIAVDGAAFDAWGVIRLGEATRRAPLSDVQAQTWVTAPQEGEDLSAGTVTFTARLTPGKYSVTVSGSDGAGGAEGRERPRTTSRSRSTERPFQSRRRRPRRPPSAAGSPYPVAHDGAPGDLVLLSPRLDAQRGDVDDSVCPGTWI
jgi:Sporulation and spore germination